MRHVDSRTRNVTRNASTSGTCIGDGVGTRPSLRVGCAARGLCWLLCRAAARPRPPQARTRRRGRSPASLRGQPGVLELDSGSRLAEPGQDLLHPGRIGRAGRARPALDGLTRPRQEGAPVVRAQPGPCRNRKPVEVVADELLRSGLHGPIIPLLGDVVEPACEVVIQSAWGGQGGAGPGSRPDARGGGPEPAGTASSRRTMRDEQD